MRRRSHRRRGAQARLRLLFFTALAIAALLSPLPTFGQVSGGGYRNVSPSVATSATNSTTATLSGAGVFTGGSVDVLGFASAYVMLSADVTGVMSVQFSIDGSNWDDIHVVNIPASGASGAHTYAIPARYMRIVYTNGAAAQSAFRLETILRKIPHSDQHVISSENISKLNDATLVRPANDVYLDISRGIISDTSVYHLFGKNATTGPSIDDIWTADGLYTWQTNAFSIEAISSSTNDVASHGSGARTVIVKGLAADWTEKQETLTMNGTSASTASTGTWIRINEAFIETSGTYASTTTNGTQDGDITVRISGAGATQNEILNSVKFGHSQAVRYTVPANKTAYVRRISVNVDGNKAADVFFWSRADADTVSAPFSPKILLLELDGVLGEEIIPFDVPLKLEAMTDFWMSGDTASGTTLVDAEVEIIIVDD